MSKILPTLIVALVAQGFCSFSEAQPIRWEIADGGNGHRYEVLTSPLLSNGVPGVIDWHRARELAELQGGYLATVNSSAESDFVFSIADSPEFWIADTVGNHFGPWLGGEQLPTATDPASDWFWLTGEPITFTNWHPGEPNDLFGRREEDRILLVATETITGTRSPYWNDESSLRRAAISYAVEYVPEPATATLTVLGVCLAIGQRRRR